MRPKPSPAELLEIARQTVRGALLAALPEERRYEALMVANAIAIAGRVLARGDAPERAELADLARLMGDKAAAPAASDAVRERLALLYGLLGDELRAGKIVPGSERHRAVFTHLRQATLDRLRESNPKALPPSALS
jgi:hypothetical protein